MVSNGVVTAVGIIERKIKLFPIIKSYIKDQHYVSLCIGYNELLGMFRMKFFYACFRRCIS